MPSCLCHSRKPPFIAINLLNKITRMNKEGKQETIRASAAQLLPLLPPKVPFPVYQETIRVFSRQSTIIPAMIGHTCAVRSSEPGSEGMRYRLADEISIFQHVPKEILA